MKLVPLTRRAIYLADAMSSLALGLGLTVFAAPLAAAAGSAMPASVLLAIGLGLLPWAAFNAWIGLRPVFPAGAARMNVAGDALWVVASLTLLAFAGSGLTTAAVMVVGLLAAGVAVIGLVKAIGLRRPAATA